MMQRILGIVMFGTAYATLVSAQPLLVRGTATLTPRTHIDLVGDYAYAVGTNSFAVIDVSDPMHPDIIGQDAPGVATLLSVDVEGDYAYCAGQNSGVVVIDVSDPESPDWVASRILTFPVLHASASGSLVAAATASSVFLLDASDPANMQILDQFGRAASWVQIDGTRMEVFCGSSSGAFVLEIDGDELALRDQFGSNTMSPLTISGPYVNFARGSEVPVLNVDDFNLAGTHDAIGLVRALAGAPGFSFVGLNTGEIQYVGQHSDDPELIGSATVSSGVTGLAVNPASHLVVASNSAGVSVLEFEPLATGTPPGIPSEFSISAYPNPFNPSTNLLLSVPAPGEYQLVVTDILGREVLAESFRLSSAKDYLLDLSGQGAGSYFVHWKGARNSAVLRVVYTP